ncbi:hypothetical protein GCM10023333_34040 [Ferrimonas pelagia]|uniref:Uncharacterized protein n=1 Tax=Ferrimonas pelagia TaxID=1177826 RepID=A0ABP9FE25_9GAMM
MPYPTLRSAGALSVPQPSPQPAFRPCFAAYSTLCSNRVHRAEANQMISIGFDTFDLSGTRRSWPYLGANVSVGINNFSFIVSSVSGDADLSVRYGNQPARRAYDCRSLYLRQW